MRDISLGQYFPGNSVLHKMDPRAKLILTIIFIVVIFVARSLSALLLLSAVTIAMMCSTGISPRVYLRGIKPIMFVIVFTTILNLFMTRGDELLFEWGIIHIYREGVNNAILMVVRITLLVLGSCVFLSYTTSPISLTDGLESLLRPLSKIHVPVHEFSMIMTIALRFIPTLIEETDKIMSAQKARGADFSSGGLIKRAKALLPVLIPLFVSAFKRADELAVAMECRCYRGGEGRTRMKVLRYHARDGVMLGIMALTVAAVVVANIYVPIYSLR